MKNLTTSLLTLSLGLAVTSNVFATKVYWTDDANDKVQKANFDGSNVEDLITNNISTPYAIDLDLTNGKIYWTDDGDNMIRRSNLDGTNTEDLVFAVPRSPEGKNSDKINTGNTIVISPFGLAIDHNNGTFYWTDASLNNIQIADLDGTNEQVVVSGLGDPSGIVVTGNGENAKIYWCDSQNTKIQRADLDGSNVEDVITAGLGIPQGIDIDGENSKIYWTNVSDNKIQRANLDGTNIEDVITGVVASFGVKIDEENQKIYWTEHTSGKVRKANLDGTNAEDVVSTGGDFFGLALEVTPDAPLSVELDSFKARQIGKTISLSWATASETENKGFNVYRKIGNNDFVQISSYENNSELVGALNTSTSSFYTFVDNSEFKNNELYTYYVSDVETNGTETKHTELAQSVVYEIKSQVVDRFQLKQNFPNPFNPSTTISYNLGENVDVSLKIYNEKGEFVKELVNENQNKGSHSVDWNGTDSFGKEVSSGTYFYKIETESFTRSQKMILLK